MRTFRIGLAALATALAVSLMAASCTDPEVPIAMSSFTEVVTATPLPELATPTPTVTPTPVVEPSNAVVPTPQPRPPGLYDDRIRLAVIYDSDTGGTADDLFLDAWLGSLAWQQSVMQDGGLGGRAVELVPFDARLFNHRAVLEEVCRGDFFAIIGSQSLGDFEGAELLGTEECNLADFPGEVYSARRAVSPVTFVSNPFLNDVRQAGPARYLVEQYPEASQNLILFYIDALQLPNETERQREMLQAQGMQVAFELPTDLEEGPSERILARWAEVGAQSLVWTADPDRLIALLEALAEADQSPVFVLCELGCYSQDFLVEGGDVVEGVYAWIPHSPFDSANARGDLFTYRFWMSTTAPEAGWSEISLKSWMSGRLFEEAFNRLLIVEPETPTREQLIEVARGIDFFTAEGVLSFTNPGAGDPTPCFALMVVRNGRWEQEYPVPPLDNDCAEANLYDLVGTKVLGITDVASVVPTDTTDTGTAPDLENPEGSTG